MNMKRILSAALVLAMLVGFVPGAGVTAKADDEPTATTTIRQDTANHQATMTVSLNVPAKEPVAYLDWDDTQKKLVEKTGDDACKTYNYVLSTDTAWGEGESAPPTWYVVSGKVTLANTVTVRGDVRLILMDGAELTASRIDEGLGAKLTIYGQSAGTGKLIVTNTNGPVIGGMSISLTVNGGAVEATSENGHAIMASSFTVNGGAVEATSKDGPAIYAGSFTVNGGTVEATSESGTAITANSFTVNGGTLTATGGGSGKALDLSAAPTITGMQVKASESATAADTIIPNDTFLNRVY